MSQTAEGVTVYVLNSDHIVDAEGFLIRIGAELNVP
jgi:hypothetical protein